VDFGKPYIDLEITEEYTIREFDEDVDPIELLWHRDNEHRTLYLIGETDWMIQLEDELPTTFIPPIFIPKHKYHRLIKGNGKLRLKIYKY
jgi:hypothetical protein